jgi:hypothetical protein
LKYQRITFFAPLLTLVVFSLAACADSKSVEPRAKAQKETELRAAEAAFAATTTAARKAAAFAAHQRRQ